MSKKANVLIVSNSDFNVDFWKELLLQDISFWTGERYIPWVNPIQMIQFWRKRKKNCSVNGECNKVIG